MRTATSAACWARRFFPENASTSARSCPIRAVPASPELVATVRRLFRRPIALRPPRSITVITSTDSAKAQIAFARVKQ